MNRFNQGSACIPSYLQVGRTGKGWTALFAYKSINCPTVLPCPTASLVCVRGCAHTRAHIRVRASACSRTGRTVGQYIDYKRFTLSNLLSFSERVGRFSVLEGWMSDLEAKRAANRAAMPGVAAIVDEFRAAFGEVSVIGGEDFGTGKRFGWVPAASPNCDRCSGALGGGRLNGQCGRMDCIAQGDVAPAPERVFCGYRLVASTWRRGR